MSKLGAICIPYAFAATSGRETPHRRRAVAPTRRPRRTAGTAAVASIGAFGGAGVTLAVVALFGVG